MPPFAPIPGKEPSRVLHHRSGSLPLRHFFHPLSIGLPLAERIERNDELLHIGANISVTVYDLESNQKIADREIYADKKRSR